MTFTLTSWPVSLQEKRALIMFEFGKLIFSIFLESSVESPRALVSNQKATLHLWCFILMEQTNTMALSLYLQQTVSNDNQLYVLMLT